LSLKYATYRVFFEIMWASQVTHLIRALSRARGVIFTLHRVLPDAPADFSPNAILQVTPQYLEYVIIRVRELGIDIVSMDEAIERIRSTEAGKKFVVLSFDDAYKDNLVHALPVLQRQKCPFILYVPTAFVDGVGRVWWQALEDVIAKQSAIAYSNDNNEMVYADTNTVAQKYQTYTRLYWRMRNMPEDQRIDFVSEFTKGYGINMDQHCRDLIMDWKQLKTFVDEPLCTIGAHTVHHYELAKLKAEHVLREIEQSIQVIRSQYGFDPVHLSFPIGRLQSAGNREYKIAKELGLASAVTTRPGAIYYRHKDQLTSLPRISLNGRFQEHRYVEILATGEIFSLFSGV